MFHPKLTRPSGGCMLLLLSTFSLPLTQRYRQFLQNQNQTTKVYRTLKRGMFMHVECTRQIDSWIKRSNLFNVLLICFHGPITWCKKINGNGAHQCPRQFFVYKDINEIRSRA